MDEKDELDFCDITIEEVKEYCMLSSRNCVSIGRLMLLLSGSQSQFEFLSDPVVAVSIYEKAKQDAINIGMKHDIYYFKEVKAENIEAIAEIVYYKKSKLQRPRLVVVGALKVEYFGKKTDDGLSYTFVRIFHIPCKSHYITFYSYNLEMVHSVNINCINFQSRDNASSVI